MLLTLYNVYKERFNDSPDAAKDDAKTEEEDTEKDKRKTNSVDIVVGLYAAYLAYKCNKNNKLMYSILAYFTNFLYLIYFAVRKFMLKNIDC